jgi:WD40 repeat protein
MEPPDHEDKSSSENKTKIGSITIPDSEINFSNMIQSPRADLYSEEESSDEEYFEVDDVVSPHEGGATGSVINVDPNNQTDEEIMQGFIVKNLDTGEISTLLQTDKTLNPIYEQLVRRIKDYNDVPITPVQEQNSEMRKERSHSLAQSLSSTKSFFKNLSGGLSFRKRSITNASENELHTSAIVPPPTTPHTHVEEIQEEEEEILDSNFIKVNATRKRLKQFSKLKRVQIIAAHAGAIWVMKFNQSGQYLATGGQDGYVIIWKINRRRRRRSKKVEVPNGDELDVSTSPTSARGVFIVEAPYRKFLNGQSGDVLDLDWSKSNFLITSSMDKKVRVWHATREECLVTFLHSEIVTGVQFHPLNETLFITGSFDEKLRLFNLRQKALVYFVDTKFMLTTVGFNGDGKIAMAGTFDGKCLFYQIGPTGMKKKTQIDVRSRRGKNKGRKVTGIVLTPDQSQVLITTNDSRMRLYSLHDYSENCKYSGLENQSSHIRATFDHTGKMIISGSENHQVYLWNVMSEARTEGKNRVTSYESFSDHDSIVTNALFAPSTDEDDGENMNGRVIVTGDFRGELRVYENVGNPIPVKWRPH